MKRKVFIALLCLITVCIYLYSLIYTKELSENISISVTRCINIIIPSLFIYMVLSSIIIESGIYRYIFIILKPLSKFVFSLPTSLFFIFIMGNICGYPIGIKLINDMYEKGEIDKKTAYVMSASSFAGGPSFLLGMIGVSIYNDEMAGMIIFMSCFAANALIAIVTNKIFKPCVKTTQISLKKPDLISSITNSAISIFKICAVIVSFSIVTTVLNEVFNKADSDSAVIIKSFFEITNITNLQNLTSSFMPMVAIASSFGGLCIILQLKSVTKLSLKYIVLSRLISCPLSALICHILIKLIDYKPADYATVAYSVKLSNISLTGTVMAAILLIFLIFTREKADV